MQSLSFGPVVELVVQLSTLGVLLGLSTSRITKRWREPIADALGMYQSRLDARWLASAFGVAGAATAALHITVAVLTGRPMSGLPTGPLIAGGLAGLAGLTLAGLSGGPEPGGKEQRQRRRRSGRKARQRSEQTPRQPDRRAELLIGSVIPGLLFALFTAASKASVASVAVVAAATAGAALAQSWLLIRIPVRAVVRRMQANTLRPAPAGFGAMAFNGALGGALISLAILTDGVHVPPERISLLVAEGAVVVLAIGCVPIVRYTALPTVEISRELVVRRATIVMRVRARDTREGVEPVFCVAGWAGDPTEPWMATFKALSRRSGRALIAIALPELSAGSGSLETSGKVPQLADFLWRAILQLSKEPVLLMATSLGGLPTLTLAQDQSAPIVGWITIGSMGFDMPGLMRLATHRSLAAPVSWLGTVTPVWIRRLFATRIRTRFNPDITEAAIKDLHMELGDRREVERILAQGPRFLMEANKSIDPGTIVIPGMALWGEGDLVSPAHNATWLQRRRPDLEVKVLAGGAHSFQMEHPDRFARVVVRSNVYARRKPAGYVQVTHPTPYSSPSQSRTATIVAGLAHAALGGLRARRLRSAS